MRDHVAPAPASPKLEVPPPVTQEPDAAKNASDTDYSVFSQEPNRDLRSLTELFDKVRTSGCCIHLALAWPHIPPRAILPGCCARSAAVDAIPRFERYLSTWDARPCERLLASKQ